MFVNYRELVNAMAARTAANQTNSFACQRQSPVDQRNNGSLAGRIADANWAFVTSARRQAGKPGSMRPADLDLIGDVRHVNR